MKRVRNIILILIIIVLIIISIIAILKLNDDSNITENTDVIIDEQTVEEETVVEWKEVIDASSYYAIDSIISKYFEQMSIYNPNYTPIITGGIDAQEIDEETLKQEAGYAKEEAREILEQYLKNYINDENISNENLEKFYEKYSDVTLNIDKLYYRNLKDFMELYYIDGILSKNSEKYDIIIVVNINTKAFTILPDEYIVEKFGDSPDLSKIDIDENMLNIEAGAYNKIEYDNISLEDMAIKYFYDYMYNLQSNPKKLYETLDEDYKKSRFSSYDDFEKYIKSNYETLTNRTVKQYSTYDDSSDNTIIYICKDQYGCYYIFKAKSVMNYTLLLDNHTVYVEKLKNIYSSADEKEKASMNIEKIIDAVNTKDYGFIYSKFDTLLKNNDYKKQADLENFINKNMYEYNSFDYEDTKVQNGEYSFNLKLTNLLNDNEESKTLKIVLELNGDTDFTITLFSVN